MTKIAFIGLGNMGSGMAANQARAGHEVRAFDLSATALDQARAAGCIPAASARDAVAGAEVVISMLPTGDHVRRLYGEDVLPRAAEDALLIDCSTIDIDSAVAVAEQAAQAGLRFADAPVSGGVMGAKAGTLAFIVGCPDGDFAAVEAALKPMARTVIYAGGPGAGQAAKICNNMLLGVSMLGTCEAFALAEQLGVDPRRFFDIASQASGQCWSLTAYCPMPGVGPDTPADHGFAGGFAAAMMLKDLKLAQEAAMKVEASTPLGKRAEALYAMFDNMGYGAYDFSAFIQLLRGRLDELP